jgi:erythronate-4-phosphate dehydrogenase
MVLAALLEVSHHLGVSLRGKTLGIVGHGNTGRNVEEKARTIGMEVLLNDPPLARETKAKKYVHLDALLDADFISLHVPLTKGGKDPTFHLFDEKRLQATRGVLIN